MLPAGRNSASPALSGKSTEVMVSGVAAEKLAWKRALAHSAPWTPAAVERPAWVWQKPQSRLETLASVWVIWSRGPAGTPVSEVADAERRGVRCEQQREVDVALHRGLHQQPVRGAHEALAHAGARVDEQALQRGRDRRRAPRERRVR